ncbi:protein FORGETTER 1-like isoform X4 [Nicotiana tabacum]|uniref:Protein FORGETTER 1-like isoform X4 n=1 Tax=Nicotiana tabacum TaxID=4097 RepID=A0AC58SDP2_TOBAC
MYISASGMYEVFRPIVGEALREMPLAQLKDKYRKLSSLEKARRGWEDEYDVSLKQCMHGPNCKLGSFCTVGRRLQEVNVLGGLILPVWGTVERVLSKQVVLYNNGISIGWAHLSIFHKPQPKNIRRICSAYSLFVSVKFPMSSLCICACLSIWRIHGSISAFTGRYLLLLAVG